MLMLRKVETTNTTMRGPGFKLPDWLEFGTLAVPPVSALQGINR